MLQGVTIKESKKPVGAQCNFLPCLAPVDGAGMCTCNTLQATGYLYTHTKLRYLRKNLQEGSCRKESTATTSCNFLIKQRRNGFSRPNSPGTPPTGKQMPGEHRQCYISSSRGPTASRGERFPGATMWVAWVLSGDPGSVTGGDRY